MQPFERVVCATDFSESSQGALDVARVWSTKLQVPLLVVHVFDPSPVGPSPGLPYPAWPTTGMSRAIHNAAEKRLAALATTTLAGVAHTTELVEHPSASLGVCDIARPTDLLVVGSHERTGLDRIVHGSVAEQIVRHAPCGVLVVHGAIDATTFPRSLLICTDFSKAATPAIITGGAVSRVFHSSATLLHARSQSTWQHDIDDAPGKADELDDNLRKNLEHLHEQHLEPPVQTAFVVAKNVPDAIVKHAAREGVDLLVLATHGRTGLSRILIGSVAERVARTATSPVLIVRTMERE